MPISSATSLPPKKPSIMLKRLCYSFFALSILLFAGYFFSPLLINSFLDWQLEKYSLQTETKIERPLSDHLLIPAMFINTIDTTSSSTVQASLQNLRINYNIVDLILNQRIQSIQIDSLNIKLEGTDPIPYQSDVSDTNTALELSAFLPSTVLAQLPFESLNIEQLTLDWLRRDKQRLTLNAKLAVDKHNVDLSAKYRENSQPIANVDIQLSADNKFVIDTSAFNNNIDGALSNNQPAINLNIQGAILQDHRQKQPSIAINTQAKLTTAHYQPDSLWIEPSIYSELAKTLPFINGELKIDKQILSPSQFINLKTWLAASSVKSEFKFKLTHTNPTLLLDKTNTAVEHSQIKKVLLKGTGNSHFQQQKIAFNINPESHIDIYALDNPRLTADKLRLTLSSPLSATLMINDAPIIESLNIDDFSAALHSDNINTLFGPLSHQPVQLNVTNLNLKSKQLTIKYHLPQIQLSPIESSSLPFQAVRSALQGSIDIGEAQIQANVDANSLLEMTKFSIAGINTEQIKVINTQPIQATINLHTKKMHISNHALSLKGTAWQSRFGELKHADVDFKIADIDLGKRKISVAFDLFEASVQAQRLPLKNIAVTASGSATLNNTAVAVTLDKGLQLHVKQLKTAGISVNNLKLRTTSNSQASANLDSFMASSATDKQSNALNNVKLSPLSAVISGSNIRYAQQKFSYQSAHINLQKIQLSPLRIQASTHIKQLTLSHHPALKKLNISASHSIANKRHRISLNLNSRHLPVKLSAKIDSRNQYQNITGSWQLAPINLAVQGVAIATHLQLPLPDTLNISAGQYQQQGQFSLKNRRITGSARHILSDLQLDIKDLSIEGINSVSNSFYNNNQLTHTGNLKINAIKHAIPITAISTDFKLNNLLDDNTSLTISNAKANMLEASLQMDDFNIPLNNLRGKSVLHFSQLPLNNILALEQQPSLTGTGTLAGKLPFNFINKQLWIKNGEIHSTDNGYIRYHANDQVRAFASTNKGLDIALSVLEDFHYKVLSINANYTPNGDLKLHNKLSGKNPNWQNGQPIEFAINIEENVLQLLKALQFSEQLTEKIQNRVEDSQK